MDSLVGSRVSEVWNKCLNLGQLEYHPGSENSEYSALLPSEDEDLSVKSGTPLLQWLITNAMLK